MNAADGLILAKSLALIEKTKQRVAQIDSSGFPTQTSIVARRLLGDTLDLIGNNATSPAVSPEALYNALIRLQTLVEAVQASSSEHVSWPLVSSCDHVWTALFPAGDTQIFYSVTSEHNYTISSFSHRLRVLLRPILLRSEVDALLGPNAVYCLQLASLEEENLPLYANIGHEFGHALWRSNEDELSKLLETHTESVFQKITAHLKAGDASAAVRRGNRTGWLIKAIATELFCDLVGFLISGPAFFLSLHEMSWGSDEKRWTGRLLPIEAHIRAYPSFRFRLHCLKERVSLGNYEAEAEKAFKTLNTDALKKMSAYASGLSSDHSEDRVTLFPESDADRSAIVGALAKYLNELKQALQAFLATCENDVLLPLRSKPEFAPLAADQVAALLHRLEHDILPNIVPDGSLLGIPAPFAAILNASALYRIFVLARAAENLKSSEAFSNLQKVERLTAKALEVSYIQQDFTKWGSSAK